MNAPASTAVTLTTITIDAALAKVSANQQDMNALQAAYAPHFQAMQQVADTAREVKADQPKKARAIRLELAAIRVAANKTRVSEKAESLRKGKAIDGIYNVLEYQIAPLEEALEAIEKAEEIKEAQRKAALLAERSEALRPFMDPTHMSLGEMTEQVFGELLAGAKTAHQNKIDNEAREKAQREADARKAEQDRIAREAEQEAERKRLAAEAETQAAAARLAAEEARKEREAREAIEKKAADEKAAADAALAKERLENERKAKERQKEIDAERLVIEQQQIRERQQAAATLHAEKLKAEIAQAEIDRLAKEKADKEKADAAAAKKAAKAPEKAKIKTLADIIRALPIPTLTSPEGSALIVQVKSQADKFANWLESEGAKL